LKCLFRMVDTNNSGTISEEELRSCLQHVGMAAYFEMKGLDVKDAEAFFRILTCMSGQDEVDVHAFVTGWLKMKGPATNLDLYTMQYQSQLWQHQLQKQLAICTDKIAQLHPDVDLKSYSRFQHQLHAAGQNNVCTEGPEKRIKSTGMCESLMERPPVQAIPHSL